MIRKLFIVIVVVWRMFTQYFKLKWKSIVDHAYKEPLDLFFILTFIFLIVGLFLGAFAFNHGFKILGALLMVTLWLVPTVIVGIYHLIKKIKKLIKSIKKEISNLKGDN